MPDTTAQVLCSYWDTKLFLGRHNTHVHSLHREPTTDQRKDPTKAQPGESMAFIEVSSRTTYRRVTYQSRNDSKTAAAPEPSLAGVTAHNTGNLEHTT